VADRDAAERGQQRREAAAERRRSARRAGETPSADATETARTDVVRTSAHDDRETPARRPVALVRQYPKDLRQDHPFVGSVVFAEVVFGGILGAKWRPAVVVAASRYFVVVRPCYSEGGFRSYDWRSTPLRDWAMAGLGRPTWVSFEERLIPRSRLGHVYGELSPYDWAQL
jgi:hypothetical protein